MSISNVGLTAILGHISPETLVRRNASARLAVLSVMSGLPSSLWIKLLKPVVTILKKMCNDLLFAVPRDGVLFPGMGAAPRDRVLFPGMGFGFRTSSPYGATPSKFPEFFFKNVKILVDKSGSMHVGT